MNQDNGFKTFCPRCNSEMNANSRYCMKCGYLNPVNQANQGMNQFISNNKSQVYQIGSGQNIAQDGNQITTSIANNTGNRLICFLLNYLVYIGIIGISFFLIIGNNVTDFNIIKESFFPDVVFITSIVFIYIYSMQLIFMKANQKWWYALIPFYNLFVLCDIVFRKKWLGIILLIPIVGQIFLLVVLYKLAIKFKCNGLLTVLFPIIFIPLMGFGSRLYEGVSYISNDKTMENDYRRKKVFFITLMVFLILSGVLLFWSNIIEIRGKATKIRNYYYVYATKQIVDKTKQLAKENYLQCSDYKYNPESGIYYIWYADIGDVAYIPLHSYMDVISGYVIIDNTTGSSKYYVTLSDGSFGYPTMLYTDVKADSIIPYGDLKEREDVNFCINTKEKLTTNGLI